MSQTVSSAGSLGGPPAAPFDPGDFFIDVLAGLPAEVSDAVNRAAVYRVLIEAAGRQGWDAAAEPMLVGLDAAWDAALRQGRA